MKEKDGSIAEGGPGLCDVALSPDLCGEVSLPKELKWEKFRLQFPIAVMSHNSG